SFMTDQVLKKAGIKVFEGFDLKNIPTDYDLVIYSTSYNKNSNIELAEVLNRKGKILTYAEATGAVFNEKYGIAVIGSHGKTTTTAWLGFVLNECGHSPSVLVGANVKQFGGASLIGASEYMVAEVDEYQNKLQHFNPKIVLLNNIDYDHPDFFPTPADYTQVFVDFISRIPNKGFLVANIDDKEIAKIAQVNTRARVVTYSIDGSADYVAYNLKTTSMGNETRQYFKVKLAGDDADDVSETELGEFAISLSGKHNVYNALAVIATALEMEVNLTCLRTALENFKGTDRRAEILGQFQGTTIIDDYAHHPTEIKATLSGLRNTYKDKNIVVVFHPHTFTRTKALFDDFADSFADADKVIVLDVYGSAREKQGGVNSADLAKKIEQSGKHTLYIPGLDECEKYLRNNSSRRDLIVLMGAGDVFRIGEKLLKQ
ncbi:MAG: UDP-N-acetylmuramate--L-alanine ligase, partial [Candidatus Magasanikbacteria bacterium]|nr:UDP-N-acetylmuramate--L-alanine ligase [Candidatus Magasanikbacteria bacterium]